MSFLRHASEDLRCLLLAQPDLDPDRRGDLGEKDFHHVVLAAAAVSLGLDVWEMGEFPDGAELLSEGNLRHVEVERSMLRATYWGSALHLLYSTETVKKK